MTHTNDSVLKEVQARREALMEKANSIKIGLGSTGGMDRNQGHTVDEESAGLLDRHSLFETGESKSSAMLLNIKRLADGVRDKSQAVATALNKDTDSLMQALDKVWLDNHRTGRSRKT